MTLPYLPGIGDTLSQQLPQLGQSLVRILNPGYDNAQMIRSAAAKNPEILQQLAKIERDSPGALQSLGFGRIGEMLGQIQESPEDKAISEAFKDPNIAKNYAKKRLLGSTETEEEATKAGTENVKANTEKTKATLPGELVETTARTSLINAQAASEVLRQRQAELDYKRSEQDAKDFENIVRKVPDLSNVNLAGLAYKLSAGMKLSTLEQAQVQRISSDKQLAPVFAKYQDNILERARLAIEQGRVDLLKNSSRSEDIAALRLAQQDQISAENQVNQMRTLLTKYGQYKSDQLGAMLIQEQNPDVKGELALVKQLRDNNEQALKDLQKRADKAKAFTEALRKQNPKLAKAMEDAEAAVNPKAGKITNPNETRVPTDSTKIPRQPANTTKPTPVSAPTPAPMATSPDIQQAVQGIQTAGIDFVKKTLAWKRLKPKQQKEAAALAGIDTTGMQ